MSRAGRGPIAGGTIRRLLAVAAALSAAPLAGQSPRRVTRLADGVYAIEHRDDGDGFASGNATVIIGERQVFVVDAGFLPPPHGRTSPRSGSGPTSR